MSVSTSIVEQKVVRMEIESSGSYMLRLLAWNAKHFPDRCVYESIEYHGAKFILILPSWMVPHQGNLRSYIKYSE